MAGSDAVLEELLSLANKHDVDGVQEHLAPDMIFNNPITGPSDRDGMRSVHSTLFEAFPDFTYHVDRTISSGDTTVLQCTVTGTHEGPLMGVQPTSRNVTIPCAFVVDVHGDKVTRWDSYFDVAGIMRALGAA